MTDGYVKLKKVQQREEWRHCTFEPEITKTKSATIIFYNQHKRLINQPKEKQRYADSYWMNCNCSYCFQC